MPEMVGIASSLVAARVLARAAATDCFGAAGVAELSAASAAGAGAKGADDESTGDGGIGGEDTGEGAGDATTSLSAEPVGGTSFMY
jgi:hypothetical protein